MKAPPFEYRCPATLNEAVALLNGDGGAKVMSGGQTLGPMLNLRLAKPRLIVDLTRIPDLKRFEDLESSVRYGACLTHANFEDGSVPDRTGGFLKRVAGGIAYRAIRTRGTIGGSLSHADPAADWLSALLLFDTTVSLRRHTGRRELALAAFAKAPLSTDANADEILTAVEVATPHADDKFGYAKLCRKTGEFAEGIGAVRRFADGRVRLVSGGGDSAPTVLDNGKEFLDGLRLSRERLFARGLGGDPYTNAVRVSALERAFEESFSA